MYYTLTLNPSIDYHMTIPGEGLRTGFINRSAGEQLFPGGKGVNVSLMLSRFGIENEALGFAAGHTGKMLCDLLEDEGCRPSFVFLEKGETRINVKLDGKIETAVNGKGPEAGDKERRALLKKLEELSEKDMLVISGNLPASMEPWLEEVFQILQSRQIRLVADMEGETLKKACKAGAFLIKPNEEELCALFGRGQEDCSEAALRQMMEECRRMGAVNVLTSLGKDGAILLTETGDFYRSSLTAQQDAVSTVGAGDTMLAAFLASLDRKPDDPAEALRFATAAGTAAAYTTWLPEESQVKNCLEAVQIEKV